MVNEAAKLPATAMVTISKGKVIAHGIVDNNRWLLESIASHLPDLTFVKNLYDEPRIMKNKCNYG